MQYQRREADKIICIDATTFNIVGMQVDEFITAYKERFREAYQEGGMGKALIELERSVTTGRIDGFASREVKGANHFKVTPYFTIHDDFGNTGILDLST